MTFTPPSAPSRVGIGYAPDQVIVFRDQGGALVEVNLDHGGITKSRMIEWFGEDWLRQQFPLWARPSGGRGAYVVGFDIAEATKTLITACCAAPRWKGTRP